MNSKFLLVLCLIGVLAVITAAEMSMTEGSNVPHDRVRRQWGYGGYGMGMRPWGMGYGMYRPWGMYGMYRPFGMMGMFG